jgi:hypothetical protein
MAVPRECFSFDTYFGTACGAIMFAEPWAQLFSAAWTGSKGQCLVYFFLDVYDLLSFLFSFEAAVSH